MHFLPSTSKRNPQPPQFASSSPRSNRIHLISRAGKVGGCLWYFVPAVSTLTSHSRWSKKPRYTSSALWKSLEKNFLLLAIPDPLCPALLNCPVQFLKTSTEENIKYLKSMDRLWALRACLTLSFTPFGHSSRVTHADDKFTSVLEQVRFHERGKQNFLFFFLLYNLTYSLEFTMFS